MMSLKQKYLSYLQLLANNRLPITRKANEDGRSVTTNHRGIAGINLKHKAFSCTPVVNKFKGVRMIDIDDNEYLDISMGFGVHLFGHHPNFIKDRISQANEDSWGLGPYNSVMFELAGGIKKLTGVERLSFFNSGTEAVMVSLRLARAYTNKSKIVIFKGGYHGHNDATLVFKTDPMSGQPLPLIPGITQSAQEDTYLLEFDSQDSLAFIRAHAREIAAVLTEPVQSRDPGLHPADFLRQLRQLTEENNIALIFDEMITGFRIHPGGAQAYFGIEADIVTYGKVIGGGMPIGIVAGKAKFLDMIDGGCWKYDGDSLPSNRKTFVAGTFCNHPLSMVAASAVVNQLLENGEQLTDQLNKMTTRFVGGINDWMKINHIPIKLSCFGSLFRFETSSTAKLFYHQLLLEGLYIWEGKTCFLSTAHSLEDIEKIKYKIIKCALLLKSCGYFNASISKIEVSELMPVPEEVLESALNIGASIKVTGQLDGLLLEIAFRYVIISEQTFSMLNVDDCIASVKTLSDKNTGEVLRKFINKDIRDQGISMLMVYEGESISYFALAGHKSIVDGWSMTLLLTRTIKVYRSLLEGSQLPFFGSGINAKDISLKRQLTINKSVSEMKKIGYLLNIPYVEMKKLARGFGTTPIELFRVCVVLAFKKTMRSDLNQLIIGSPVAAQLKEGKSDVIGALTSIESWLYDLAAINEFSECFGGKNAVSKDEPVIVVNIDRLVGDINIPLCELTPQPLDPMYIYYDIVVNALVRKEGLWIDFKWRKEKYTEQEIKRLIAYFNNLISNQDATIKS